MGFGISCSGFERRGLHVEQGLEVGPALFKRALDNDRDENLMHDEVKGRPVRYTYARWVRAYLSKMLDNGWVPAFNITTETLQMAKDTTIVTLEGFTVVDPNWAVGKSQSLSCRPFAFFNDVDVYNVATGKRVSIQLEVGTLSQAERGAAAINNAAGVVAAADN